MHKKLVFLFLQTLKSEVAELKTELASVPRESAVVLSSGPPSTGADLSKLTTEELRAKLVQYQEFMAKYIVQAQQQKMKAVRAAELATAAKYEAKIKLLLASADDASAAAPAAPAAAAATSSPETKLYDTRSANVAAAAKAGKSRWGDKEVAKVKIASDSLDSFTPVADDEVNGKANGFAATAPAPVSLPGSGLFEERNKRVAAAAAAGKSRWGDAEVQKAASQQQPTLESAPSSAPAAPKIAVTMSPEIEAADHGLRNDGGVGGPSLAERVNLGQQLFTGGASQPAVAAAAAAPAAPVTLVASKYDLRNARVAASAAVGKSRWGSMEIAKATSLAASAKSLNGATAVAEMPGIVSTPEIEAADHGLRNDGGVGGPSLAERVNLGSGLLKD